MKKRNLLSCVNIIVLCAVLVLGGGIAYSQITYTDNLSLAKPALGTAGSVWLSKINNNQDVLDAEHDPSAIFNASSTLVGETIGTPGATNVISVGGVTHTSILNDTSSAGGDCTGTFGSLNCSDIVNSIDSGEIMHTPDESVDNSIPRANGTSGVVFQNSTVLIDDNDYLDMRSIHAGYGISNHSGTVDFALTGSGTYDIINGNTAIVVSEESGGAYADATGGIDPSIEIGASGAGEYLISLTASFETDNADTFLCSMFKEGSQTAISFHRKMAAGTDVGSAASTRLLTLAADDTLDIRCAAAGSGADGINFNHLDLTVIKVSR